MLIKITKLDKYNIIFIALVLILFAFSQIGQLTVPALHDEEGHDVAHTLAIMQVMSEYVTHYNSIYYGLFKMIWENKFVTMLTEYHGVLQAYIAIPFFIFINNGVIASRIYEIFIGMLIIVITFIFTKEYFDTNTAYVSTLLLLFNFSFVVHTTKYGIAYGAILQFIMFLALLLFLLFYKNNKFIYLFMGAFLLGAGLSIRSWFIWFIFGLFFAAFLVLRKEIYKLLCFQKTKIYKSILNLVTTVIFFCLGFILVIYYNITSDFEMIRYAIDKFAMTQSSYNNLKYFNNLAVAFNEFTLFLQGELENVFRMYNYGRNYVFPYLAGICMLFLIYTIFNRNLSNKLLLNRKKVSFLIAIFISMLFCMPTTLSMLRIDHLLLFYPLIQILMAVALINCLKLFSNRPLKLLIIMPFLLVTIWDAVLFFQIRKDFIRTGGRGVFSDSTYQLVDFIKSKNASVIYNCIPANTIRLQVSSRMEKPITNLNFLEKEDLEDISEIEELLPEGFYKTGNLYILFEGNEDDRQHDVNRYIFKKYFESYIRINNIKVEKKIFYSRLGFPTFIVYELL